VHRLIGFLARRQYGKTTTFSGIAMRKMMKRPNELVTYASATLLLGRELIQKEARVIQQALKQLAADASEQMVEVADRESGKVPDKLTEDDFAGLFEAQRLEFRLYHDRNTISRTIIIAPNPSTAVGWTGNVLLDEVGRIKNFREVWEAVEPIASSDPTFRLLLCTTPPPDDTHFSFEMLAPPLGTEFEARPEGNWYRSEMGVLVLRVDAFDAYKDGVPVYDLEKGEPLAPTEHRRRSMDKEAWDRNYGVKFILGGTAACGLLQLDTAMRRGIGQCACVIVEDDSDFEQGIEFLRTHLGAGGIGLGWDLATTEKETSNPSVFTVMEQNALDYIARTVFVWKTRDPDVALYRAKRIIETVKKRELGGRARRLCIDATNERYFATIAQKSLAAELPVDLVIASESIERPGEEPITMKSYLGAELVAILDDNKLTLPPERYIKEDFRLVKRDRGTFVCDPAPDGKHGDSFDGTKLALRALRIGGTMAYQVVRPSSGGFNKRVPIGRRKGVLV
jgi:hypothetical protein